MADLPGKIRHWRLGEGERPMPTGGEEGDGQAEDGELHLPSTWRPSSISGSAIQHRSLIEMNRRRFFRCDARGNFHTAWIKFPIQPSFSMMRGDSMNG
ncbi:MAG: hypothetical protein GIX02_12805 [Candidatus Eremiobacteraeota bacterium]|nr:hypothetical protein [Candidatus Eremiobacteraeota bacterium]